VIKPPFNFLQVKMEVLPGNSTILVKPVFGKRPESFYPVEVISTFRFTLLFSHNYMIATDWEKGVSKPVIGVVKAPWFSMVSNQGNQSVSSSTGDGESEYFPVSLVDAKDHVFSRSAPASLSGTLPPNIVSSISKVPERVSSSFRVLW